jgi:uncharacterized repeat protein (TIGR01451 family)
MSFVQIITKKNIDSAIENKVAPTLISLIFSFLYLFIPTNAQAVDLVLNGTKTLLSGVECGVSKYRFGTTSSYNGKQLDLILDVLEEDNDYFGPCVQLTGNQVSFYLRDEDAGDNIAYMDLKFTVVEKGTLTPVEVDRILVTNFDLDRSDSLSLSATDDVYYRNADGAYISNNSLVQYSEGAFYGGKYNVKMRGRTSGNCNDSTSTTDVTCRAAAIWINGENGVNKISTIYARAQNDNAYGTSANRNYLRLIQFSFELIHFENLVTVASDYGDAPNSYGSAGHKLSANIGMGFGEIADNENAHQASNQANSDDNDTGAGNFDDENAVTLNGQDLNGQILQAETSKNLTVKTFGAGYLSGWIDWNRDGDFNDSDEQFLDDFHITTTSIGSNTIPINIPAHIRNGDSFIRFRYTTVQGIAASGYSTKPGEVEDYHIVLQVTEDHGDAPAIYGDAIHSFPATPSVYLGSVVPDNELTANTPLDGTGDDKATDDEDALNKLPAINTDSSSYTLNIPCTGNATVAAWIDFNRNNIFDVNERQSAVCSATSVTLSWTSLNALTAGKTYVRIRIASNADEVANPDGWASDGEVEDYALTIVPPDYDYSDAPNDGTDFNYGIAKHLLPADPKLFIGAIKPSKDDDTEFAGWQQEWVNNGKHKNWFGFKKFPFLSGNGQSTSPLPDVVGDGTEEDGMTHTAFGWKNGANCTGTLPDGTQGTVTMTDTLYCITVNANNNLSIAAQLVGWIDFNQNGEFDDPGERSVVNLDADINNDATQGNVPAGSTNQPIVIYWNNQTKVSGDLNTFIRLRLTSDPIFKSNHSPDPVGIASNGEVEDSALTVNTNNATGKVEDTDGNPVENVSLTIKDNAGNTVNNANGQPLTTITDANGNYIFSSIPAGDYTIVMRIPAGYVVINDGDASADGDTDANSNFIDGIIPLSMTEDKEDTDNDFVLAIITHNAITQCSAGNLPENLIEYHFTEPVEGGVKDAATSFVNVNDTRHFTNVAVVNGRQVDAVLTIDEINSSAPVGRQVQVIYNATDEAAVVRVESGPAHSTDNYVKYHIDFVHTDDGSPAAYSFAYHGSDIDGSVGQRQEYLRYYSSELSATMVSNPTNLIEIAVADYQEYRGTAAQNGEPESAVVAIFNNKSTINITVGQRDTEGEADFLLNFERNKFILPFCNGYDFGDAQGYNTTGITAARHKVVDDLYLGAQVDIDNGTQENISALSDDDSGIINAATHDDENGIANFPELNDLDTSYSLAVSVTNNTGRVAKLIGWIDVDDNGVFDADEASVITSVATGTNAANVILNWAAIPTDIVAHDSYLRVRLTTDALSANDAGGTKSDGEVEDYALTIKVGGFPVRGRVYNDTNVDAQNDAINEKGLSGLSVVLVDVINNTCVSTKTDGDGNYIFFPVIPGDYQLYEASLETVTVPQNCDITKSKDPAGYRSTTANVLDQFSVIDAEITGKDFGDVKDPLFTPNHSGTVLPGNVVFYAHKFTAKTTGIVNFSGSNSGGATAGWSNIIYQDINCNGKLDGAEASSAVAANLATIAEQNICLINKVYAPNNIATGEIYRNTINADFNFNNNALAGSIRLKVTDLTKAAANDSVAPEAGSSKLELRKTVQNITRGTAETETQNQAKPGDVLHYRIYYSNTGTGVITDLKIDDVVPDFTLLKANTVKCDTTLAGLNCNPNATNNPDLSWDFTGILKGGAKGSVSYQVIID